MMDQEITKLLNLYLESYATKQKLERQLNEIKSDMNRLTEEIIEQFQDEGISNITLEHDGIKKQVVMRRMIVTSINDNYTKPQIVDALKDTEWNSIVEETYNTARLDALVRQAVPDGDKWPQLPEAIDEMLDVKELYRLSVTKR